MIVFTKENTKYVYGIAIILMILHHLMGFPNRFNYELISAFPYEYQIGVFSKICVGMYAFVTGYGLAVNVKSSTKDNVYVALDRLVGVYKKYWLVYLIFIPIGICINEINASFLEYVCNFLGIKSTFNGEWWYVKQYVFILLSFPFIWQAINFLDKYKVIVRSLLSLVMLIGLRYFSPYLALSYVGMIFQKYLLFEKMHIMKANKKYPRLFPLFLVFIVVLVRAINPSVKLDVFIVPFFIYGLLSIKKAVSINYKIVEFLGELSVFIWLTHTFYMYHYFQDVVLISKYSPVVFFITIILSVLTAYILNTVYKNLLE